MLENNEAKFHLDGSSIQLQVNINNTKNIKLLVFIVLGGETFYVFVGFQTYSYFVFELFD